MDKDEQQFPSESSAKQRTDEKSRGERTEEEVGKNPIAEDPGLVGDGSDWEATAQEVRQQPTDKEGPDQEGTQHDEGRKEEDEGLLDKLKGE